MHTAKALLRLTWSAIIAAIIGITAPPKIDMHKSADTRGTDVCIFRSVRLKISGNCTELKNPTATSNAAETAPFVASAATIYAVVMAAEAFNT